MININRKIKIKRALSGSILKCENHLCHRKFYRQKHEILAHNYCSKSCAASVNNRKFPKNPARIKVCVRCGTEFKQALKRNKFCSQKCYSLFRKNATKYSKAGVIGLIRAKFKSLKRVPARRELGPASYAAVRLFGTWNKAMLTSGLDPNRSHDDRMYKRSKTKAADGHICDSISEALVDNWLSQHKIIHERNVSYPTTKHRTDWAIKNGKIFIEYFGLAKDSPRYDRAIRNKKTLCKKHNIQLIEIYPKDLYPKLILENKFGPIV